MIRAAALILALGLAGCATPEQLAAQDDAKCSSLGAPAGSPGYANCRITAAFYRKQEEENALARQQQAFQSFMAQNTAPASAGAAAPVGFTKVCTYNTIFGQRAITVGATDICPITLPQ